jgi:acyl carrier protein phosphodiesterase
MNFLAHLHLSGDSDDIKLGNFIGDFVKGKEIDSYPEGIRSGIRLHRIIDSFTDSHAIVSESKSKLRGKYRHYSGVIVDVYYDHFLARNWGKYSSDPLDQFAEDAYELVRSRLHELPDRVPNLLYYMSKGNWLYNYQYVEGIRKTLTGMSNRTRFESKMQEAHQELVDHYDFFRAKFDLFYPELQKEVNKFLNDGGS